MFLELLLLLVIIMFVPVGIMKNKNEQYLKQTGFVMVALSILNAIVLSDARNSLRFGGDQTTYLILFHINPSQANGLYQGSIALAIVGLLIYLYADV